MPWLALIGFAIGMKPNSGGYLFVSWGKYTPPYRFHMITIICQAAWSGCFFFLMFEENQGLAAWGGRKLLPLPELPPIFRIWPKRERPRLLLTLRSLVVPELRGGRGYAALPRPGCADHPC